MYVLDTNLVSEIRKVPAKKNPAVQRWLEQQYSDQLFITSVTVYELEVGVQRLARKDSAQAVLIGDWLHGTLLPGFEGRVLDLDLESSLIAATYQVPDPRPSADCFIAAITQRHHMKLVTRNTKDFLATNIPLINPWNE